MLSLWFWFAIWNLAPFITFIIFITNLSWEWVEVSNQKSAKIQTSIQNHNDSNQSKIWFKMALQTKSNKTLISLFGLHLSYINLTMWLLETSTTINLMNVIPMSDDKSLSRNGPKYALGIASNSKRDNSNRNLWW